MASLYNSKYYHRDLSWLRFNHRVLQEAADRRNSSYERIKFLAIFSSNLDEFFKVRISDIRQVKKIEKNLRKRLIKKPNKVLKEIKTQVDILQNEFGVIYKDQIVPALLKENICIVNDTTFAPAQKLIAKAYYEDEILPLLIIEEFHKDQLPSISVKNEALYLTSQRTKDHLLWIQIPESLSRFYVFPKQNGLHYVCFLDDILRYNLRQSPQAENTEDWYSVKISKDAELYIEDELSGVLKDKIEASLSHRETGQATRVLIDSKTPKELQGLLKNILDITNTDIILGGKYHNLKDFFSFPNPTEKNLSNVALLPITTSFLEKEVSLFEKISNKDQLFHFPYHSFEPVLCFF